MVFLEQVIDLTIVRYHWSTWLPAIRRGESRLRLGGVCLETHEGRGLHQAVGRLTVDDEQSPRAPSRSDAYIHTRQINR